VSAETFADTLRQSVRDDLAAQRTTRGIHKDDYLFSNDGYPVKKFASQGQLKTYVISLKLAQYRMIRDVSGISPILLLDDIFDKLDDTRIANLLATLFTKGFGQIFISDARPERSQQHFLEIDKKPKFFYLDTPEPTGPTEA
jgi:DNA replication and repair protein RecF